MKYNKLLTFSFDDGVCQDERFINILNEFSLKATFNLNSEFLGDDGFLMIDGKKINHKKISPERVKDIYKGHEIAAHTLTHPLLTKESDEEIIRQVENDRKNLSQLAGYEVRGFAYPCGGINCDERVARIIKANTGVEYARTIMHSYSFDLQEDMYLFKPTASLTKDKAQIIKLAEDFINLRTNDIKLFYIWGHSYELDINDDWDFFREFCRLISGKDDILYCTNIEAFNYIKNN